jgi:hypothetical protein
MRKLIACMATLAFVTACGQGGDDPAAVETTEAAPAATMETYVGSWNVTYADGSIGTTTNNADGTFFRQLGDDTENAGTWTFTPEQSCWTTEGGEPECYTISPADADGMITLTATDGSTVTARRALTDAARPLAPMSEGTAPAEAGETM